MTMLHSNQLFDDTAPHVATMMVQHWRDTPPLQKIAQIGSLNATLRQLALAGLAHQYPADTPEKLLRRYRERLLGSELVQN